jgi:hypothetical protein
MPYLTQVRMRATCVGGISAGSGVGMTGLAGSSSRAGAGGGTIRSTRGLRADGSAGAVCGAAGGGIGDFAVNRASAAWRALLIRWRSSLRGCGCRLRKICSEWWIHSRLSKGRFGRYGKPDLGRRGAIRKPALNPAPPQCRRKIEMSPRTQSRNDTPRAGRGRGVGRARSLCGAQRPTDVRRTEACSRARCFVTERASARSARRTA